MNFPTSPSIGDTYALGTKTWKWNGVAWDLVSTGLTSTHVVTALGFTPLNKAGDTLTGALSVSGDVTLNGGTANGVTYLNGSKVLTSGSALTFDGANFASTGNITSGGVLQALTTVQSSSGADLSLNANGANRDVIYKVNATELMRLVGSTGNLGIGTSSPQVQLHLQSSAPVIRLTDTSASTDAEIFCNSAAGSMYLRADQTNVAANSVIGFQIDGSDKMTLDSAGNLGLGVSPSAWSTGKAFEIGHVGNAIFDVASSQLTITQNAYYNGGYKYGASTTASRYDQGAGSHIWWTAPSGTAGNAITFTQAMTLDASGNLGVGTTSPSARIDLVKASGSGDVGKWSLSGGAACYMYAGGSVAGIFDGANSAGNGIYFGGSSVDIRFQGSGSERARISSTGGFSVGTTADPGAGAILASGNITAYSDERLKKDWSDLPADFVERLAEVKHGTYTRIDSGQRQAGVGAQSLRPLLPEVILEGEHLAVAYGNAAMVSAVELAKRVVRLEKALANLMGD